VGEATLQAGPTYKRRGSPARSFPSGPTLIS
jgi:hypothetical protein